MLAIFFDFFITSVSLNFVVVNTVVHSTVMCLLQNLMERTLYTNLRIEQFNYTIEESPHFYTF